MPKLRYAGQHSRVEEVGEREADGWVPARMLFEVIEDARAFVLSCGDPIEPLDLHEEIALLAQQTAALYG